ncbi:hypothetical protein [Kordiimonas gwangyangensis]|uniref:hypothetical protein n=1 Tax=Kordiimonas gwangyangensis TaxID=288022 RepID=UPI00037C1743|nr:hypothetical protein [Kordiimonas gwangyangensis]
MDVKKKILQHLEKEGDDARHKDGDALIDEIEAKYDAPREVIEQTVADWMAGEKLKHGSH